MRIPKKIASKVEYIADWLLAVATGNVALRQSKLLILSNWYFDAKWYLETYPDVRRARMNAAVHYLKYGHDEGRDPSEHFSTNAYLFVHRDVKGSGSNALVHFIEHGAREGRVILPAAKGKELLSNEQGREVLSNLNKLDPSLAGAMIDPNQREKATGGFIPHFYSFERRVSEQVEP